ncbi:unnamed protein product [Rotaria sordida]|uniref:Poly [ADP-ribose] polymerase n=1 Tax=Rotaria sordida TaxID=392033 RepID=A0A814W2B7_9BILA|nr:unnamed protein product [Rotaria sordida]
MMCESKTFVITYPKYKVNNQTILQEQFDENYEPTQEEIREYAIYIGIDPRKELHLLWLAREGIMKPLPPGWKSCQEENGELYYFNFDTGKSSWDHPCDEIYKARVIEERRKQPSSSTNLFNTNPRGTLSQKDRSKSTVSDYLSSGKKLLTMGAINNTSLITKNKVQTKKYDSQYVNSDNDELEEELMKSDDDDDEQSSDDFRKKVDFGIDLTLSARIERKEKEAPTTSALAASRSLNSIKNTADIREPSHYQVPKTWEKSRKNKICFELSNTADEYKSIVTNFNLPMKGKYTQIIRIERIQNERWYIQYLAHSRNFKKYLDKDTEKCLYHGCSEEAANAIMKSCFNRSFAGVNGKFMSHLVRFILITLLPLGTLYGVGVYFSSNAAYSHDYTKPNVNGERCMFWARVLVGNTTVGNSSMKTCPAEFDSTTDGKHIFVTYHDAQAYAEYLITYK